MALTSGFHLAFEVATYYSNTNLYFQVGVPIYGCPTNYISDQSQQFLSALNTTARRDNFEKNDKVIESTEPQNEINKVLDACTTAFSWAINFLGGDESYVQQ